MTASGVKSIIKSMSEGKYHDKTDNANYISWHTAGPYILSDVTQGAGDEERVGDKISISSLELKIQLYTTGHASYGLATRLIVFQWYDDSIPIITDVIYDDTKPLVSPYVHDTKVKRKILLDKQINNINDWACVVSGDDQSISQNNNHMALRYFIDFKKKGPKRTNVHFVSTSTVANGHLYFMVLGVSLHNGNTYDAAACCQVYSRMNFTDL